MIELITGSPGAGKTLMTVSRVLLPMVGQTLTDLNGVSHNRRLCIGGIPDLLLPHEPVTVRAFDPERGAEPSDGRLRSPGEPPIPGVEMSADNWWQWCLPGDVIVIDECQRLFRPMASGRKVPLFISMLETHRHYGIDIVLITQHPQLIHSNVRALVGKHRDVRRLFGGMQRMVYEWDRCSSVERRKDATSMTWRPDKSAYSLYKSSEIHTKQSFSMPLPLIVAVCMLIILPLLLWYAYGRVTGSLSPGRGHVVAHASAGPVQSHVPSPTIPPPAASAAQPEHVDSPASSPGASGPGVELAGCITLGARCSCVDRLGHSVPLPDAVCRHSSREYGQAIPYPVEPSPVTNYSAVAANPASSPL